MRWIALALALGAAACAPGGDGGIGGTGAAGSGKPVACGFEVPCEAVR